MELNFKIAVETIRLEYSRGGIYSVPIEPATAIAAGAEHTCALGESGDLDAVGGGGSRSIFLAIPIAVVGDAATSTASTSSRRWR